MLEGTPSVAPIPNQNPATPEGAGVNETQKTEPVKPMEPVKPVKLAKEKSKLMPVMVILAVLAVAGVVFGVVGMVQSASKQDQIKTLEEKLSKLEQTDNGDDNEGEEKPGENDGEEKPEETVDKAKILAEVPGMLAFTGKRCLNCEGELQYGAFDMLSYNGADAFRVGLDLETGAPTLSVQWDTLKNIGLPLDTAGKSGWEQFTDLQLSGRATDVKIAQFGQSFGYETAVFLMEDGSVEYIPIIKALKSGSVKSYGKLDGVNEVIKFYRGSSIPKDAMIGGGSQTLAQRADGNFYELYGLIEKAGGFEGIF